MVLGRIQQTRGGQAYDSSWGQRMTGSGQIAEQISNMFRIFKQKFELDQKLPPQRCDLFVPPASKSGQLRLF